MALSRITDPVLEPITLSEAKLQCLISEDITDQDLLISDVMIPAVRDRAEVATQRALMTQTWDLVMDAFPADGYIEIPRPPLVSVTYLKYRDTAGVLQTWAASNYVVTTPAGPRCRRGRLSLARSVVWPSTYGQAGDVTVRFVCGHAQATAVAPILRAAMLLDLGTLYAQREQVVTGTIVAELPGGSRDIYRSCRSHGRQKVGA